MFSVIFEVQPRPEQWDAYLGQARALRPELEGIDGFIDNVRYRSLTREGRLLSLSGWRDEKSVVRWRTTMRHHIAQEKGRSVILLDYHLRVGEVTRDTEMLPDVLRDQRLDETETGEAKALSLVTGPSPHGATAPIDAAEAARWLGLDPVAAGLVAWDVLEALLTPGDLILLISWRDKEAALAYGAGLAPPNGGRLRQVRVIRDYGMFDRREAPQYYPDVTRRN